MKNKGFLVILVVTLLTLIMSSCGGTGPKLVLVTAITVMGEDNQETVLLGDTLQMEVQVLPLNAYNKDVTWSVENAIGVTDRETGAEITQDGVLTGVSVGTVFVKATAKDGSGIEGIKSITVIQQPHTVPEMVIVNGGTFLMGNTRDDDEAWDDEKPVHEVELTYDYEIGKYELTNAQFLEFLNDAGVTETGQLNGHEVIDMDSETCEFTYTGGKFSLIQEGKANYPVHSITWWGGTEYCNWLSEKEGLADAYDNEGNLLNTIGDETQEITQVEGYRLLTIAEWEYAARGGQVDIRGTETNDYKYTGSNDIDEVAWYGENSQNLMYPIYEGRGTHEVGQKGSNELGLYDMSGNVWEWCHDGYGDYPSIKQTNPIGLESPSDRIVRGGSWVNKAEFCRVAFRFANVPSLSADGVGFRISRTRE